MKANSHTGLTTPAVYYVGHVTADIDGNYRVTNADLIAVRPHVSANLVPLSNVQDVNKDMRVTNADLTLIRSRVGASLLLNNIVIPAEGSSEEGASPPGPPPPVSFRSPVETQSEPPNKVVPRIEDSLGENRHRFFHPIAPSTRQAIMVNKPLGNPERRVREVHPPMDIHRFDACYARFEELLSDRDRLSDL